jgi:hypothetical protein
MKIRDLVNFDMLVTIPVSTFTIELVFENCFLSAMAPYTLVMGGAYPYMDLNAKYEKLYYDVLLRLIQFVTLIGAQAE